MKVFFWSFSPDHYESFVSIQNIILLKNAVLCDENISFDVIKLRCYRSCSPYFSSNSTVSENCSPFYSNKTWAQLLRISASCQGNQTNKKILIVALMSLPCISGALYYIFWLIFVFWHIPNFVDVSRFSSLKGNIGWISWTCSFMKKSFPQ